MHRPLSEDEARTMLDWLSLTQCQALGARLLPREHQALYLRDERGLRLDAVAAHFGVSRERVRQILARAHQKMRGRGYA